MAFDLRLVKPTETSGGILGFYRDYPAAGEVLQAWGRGQMPTPAQLDALLNVILFFVVEEQKPEARNELLNNASIQDVIRIVHSLPQLLTA